MATVAVVGKNEEEDDEDHQSIVSQIQLSTAQDIDDLLCMTPYYWHLSPSIQQKIKQLESLTVTTHMEVYTYRPNDILL